MKQAEPGRRRTRQRDVIDRAIRDAPGPLTVPEILERAQREVPGLGIATVYRTLKLLQEAEEVRTVVLPGGEARYEPSDRGHHHHFHCRVCGAVYDLEGCGIPARGGVEVRDGFVVEDHELTLYGVCPECSG